MKQQIEIDVPEGKDCCVVHRFFPLGGEYSTSITKYRNGLCGQIRLHMRIQKPEPYYSSKYMRKVEV